MRRFLFFAALFSVFSCIRNDIPYPVVPADILAVEGVGFTCTPEDIDAKNRIVTLHLDEVTDRMNVEITSIRITDGAVSDVPLTGKIDLSADYAATLTIYQDYDWIIRAEQNIPRYFVVEGQIGASEIDVEKKTAVAKVPMDTDLNNIRITGLKLGPEGITEMSPLPEEITSFENYRTVDISYHSIKETWYLSVVPTDVKVSFTSVDVWTRVVWLYAQGIPDTEVGFRYRLAGSEEWTDVEKDKILVDGGVFSACLSGLEPETQYEIVAFSGGDESEVANVTTRAEIQIPNAGFEEWYTLKGIVYPGTESGAPFWATGNPGAAIAGITMTNLTEDPRPGSSGKYAAKLESKLAGIAGIGKLAAGNIFTGQYVATRGTNGVVCFGRPFTERPTALRGWVKYNQGKITNVGPVQPEGFNFSKGDPDSGIIFLALGTWTPEEYGISSAEPGTMFGTADVPYCVDTRDVSTFFTPNKPAVIAYGEMILDKNIDQWQEFTIKLDYNSTDQVPTHMILICTASRFGDYYIGSSNSIMWVDDLELVYDVVE